ncbi:MAG: ribonuclease III [Chthoniobacterales bacterium]
MHPLEERIPHQFQNPQLLTEALTHPSVRHEKQRAHFDNQRLEFLGDAVLQLVITEHLFGLFAEAGEGRLTIRRARLVSRSSLEAHARKIDLGSHLLLGRGEEASGGRIRPSNLADAFEALLGAIFLDGGIEPARRFILAEMAEELGRLEEEPLEMNPKGQLQERLQSISPRSPVYELVAQEGREHERTFSVRVFWEGQLLGEGTGRSKKQAETAAALAALREEAWTKSTDAAPAND